MTAFDEKLVEISSCAKAEISLEVDIDGTGLWIPYSTFPINEGETVTHTFGEGFSAYRVRAVSSAATTASVIFEYR